MARLAKIVNNEKKIKLEQKYRSLRNELRAKVKDTKATEEERMEAQSKLNKLPRNSCPTRVRNRCQVTGRTRGYLGYFNLSRIAFRELAHRGMIPGVTKSSW